MHIDERPIDLSAVRRARALAHPPTTGDRWADLHRVPQRPAPRPAPHATVIPFGPPR